MGLILSPRPPNIRWVVGLACTLSVVGAGCKPSSTTSGGTSTDGDTPDRLVAEIDPLTFDLEQIDPAVVEAIEMARSDVQAKPESSRSWGHLGMVLLAHDANDAAVNAFVQAARFDDREPRWPYFESIARQAQDPTAAREPLSRAVRLFGPRVSAPQLRLVELLLDLDELGEAEAVLAKLLQNDSDNVQAHTALAKLRLRRNQPQECLNGLEQAEGSELTRQGMLLAAEAHRRLGQMREAEQKNRMAMALPAKNADDPIYREVVSLRTGLKTQLAKADSLFVQNRALESVQLLEQVVKDYPESEWAQILLARGLIRLRRLSEAHSALQRAIELNPKSFEAHFRTAVAYQVDRQFEEAAEWFEKTIELQPASAVALKNLGLCRFALKQLDAAEAALKGSVTVHPNYFDGHVALGDFYARQGKFESALESLRAAQQLRPAQQQVPLMIKQLEEELNR